MISEEELVRKIDSGDGSVMQLMEENPEYQDLLKAYSGNARAALESDLEQLGARLEEARNLVTGHNMADNDKTAVIGKISVLVKELREIRNEADGKLTAEDRAQLFTSDQTYEPLLKNALNTLNGMYPEGSNERQSIELLNGDREAAGFSGLFR